MYTYLFLRAHTSSSPPSVHIPHFHFFCLAIARISSFAVVIVSAACSVLAEDNAGTDVPAPTSTPLAYADDDGNLHLTVPGGKAVTAKGALSGDDGDATEGTVNVIQKINELKRRLANLKEKRSGTQKSLCIVCVCVCVCVCVNIKTYMLPNRYSCQRNSKGAQKKHRYGRMDWCKDFWALCARWALQQRSGGHA